MPRKTTDLNDSEALGKNKKNTIKEDKKTKITKDLVEEKIKKIPAKTSPTKNKIKTSIKEELPSKKEVSNNKTISLQKKTETRGKAQTVKETSSSTKKSSNLSKKSSSVSSSKKVGINSSSKSEKKLFSKNVDKKDVETTLNKIKEILSSNIKDISSKEIKELLNADVTDILNSDVKDLLAILLDKKSSKNKSKTEVVTEEVSPSSIIINDNGKITISKPAKGSKKNLVTKTFKPEYYDLPYRYNETVVKILAQTPKRLFIYWDISDKDIESYKKTFGEDFFNSTYPVLLVHNVEKNYTFEVQTNDFANSWYIDINDPKCTYKIELGRKFKQLPKIVDNTDLENHHINLQNDYLCITTSNNLEVPNDHILFENFKSYVTYKNVKTLQETSKNIESLPISRKINKIYNIYDLYKEIYSTSDDENFSFDLSNPSSGNPTSSFK